MVPISNICTQVVEEEAAKRIELLVKKRVEEELEKRKDEIEQEVAKRVEEAKRKMEKEMMEELEKEREQQRRKELARQVTATFWPQPCATAIHLDVALTHGTKCYAKTTVLVLASFQHPKCIISMFNSNIMYNRN